MSSRAVPGGAAPTATLSARMRDETQIAHRLAEGTQLAKAFFAGHLSRARYVVALRCIHRVYEALEEGLETRRSVALVDAARHPSLYRTGPLERDLAHFGATPATLLEGSPAAAYADRVRTCATLFPERLVAHAYTRYLGDLSGGRIAARVARWVLRFPTSEGLSFFEYQGVEPAPMRRRFKAGIDAVPVSPELADQLVEETRLAFELHRALADALMSDLPLIVD